MKQVKREAPNSLVETDPLIIAIHNQADHIVTLEKERDAIKFDPLSLKKKKLDKKITKEKERLAKLQEKEAARKKAGTGSKNARKVVPVVLVLLFLLFWGTTPKERNIERSVTAPVATALETAAPTATTPATPIPTTTASAADKSTDKLKLITDDAEQINEVPQVSPLLPSESVEKSASTGSRAAIVSEQIESSFSVLFIDCGQGDAALVECDGKYMLVDGGNKDSSQLLYKTLKDRNITYLDIVIATHPHEDHIGGIPGALNYADAGLILCNVSKYESEEFYDFENYSNLKGNGITVPSQGASYSLGSSEITILGLNNGGSINDDSIVFRISYGNTSILFMGDAEHAGENAILGGADSLESTAIKIGHHGADNATSDSLINAVKPQYAILSVGKGNTFGHPYDSTLQTLHNFGASIYRTDLHGDILFTSDGEHFKVSTEKHPALSEVLISGAFIAPTPAVTPEPVKTLPQNEAPAVDYIVNTNSGKFHYPNCKSVKKMNESNKWFFSGTRDELINMGYSPCGNCHP